MNGFQDKVKEAMQNKTVVPLEAYPQTIKRSVYFRILLDGNAIAKQDHHFTQALYCSMHLFALIAGSSVYEFRTRRNPAHTGYL